MSIRKNNRYARPHLKRIQIQATPERTTNPLRQKTPLLQSTKFDTATLPRGARSLRS